MSVGASVDGSLSGVVAARTKIASVDGQKGVALIHGYRLDQLASQCSYEQVAYLVLSGALGTRSDVQGFSRLLMEGSSLSSEELTLFRSMRRQHSPADALAGALALAESREQQNETNIAARVARLLGRVPSLVAATAGFDPSPGEIGYARRALTALGAQRSDTPAVRAAEVLLCLESEHGLAASTFACRVAGSSGAGPGPSLAAALATLSGPRHGGATAQARALLLEAKAHGNTDVFVREKYERKARLPGFGHRIYKVPDPRVPPLRAAMQSMQNVPLLDVAVALDRSAEGLYGRKGVHANVDLYGAVLLDALGVSSEFYVAAFALGLVAGWLAHWVEQRETGRLVRPESEYDGPSERAVPASGWPTTPA